jgi:transposase
MLYAGLDLSRKRLDFHLLDGGVARRSRSVRSRLSGRSAWTNAAARSSWPTDPGGDRVDEGARFVHDQLERAGWQVEIADAQRVKGLAPLAGKTGACAFFCVSVGG